MRIVKGAVFLLFLAAGIGFAIRNDQPVSLKYYLGWVSLPLPLYLWAFFSIFIGLIISGLMVVLSKAILQSRIRQQKKEMAELERKRNTLKAGRPLP